MNIEDIRDRATITIPEAAVILGVGRDAAYAAAGKGQIPTLRLGRRLIVPVPALLAMLGVAGEAADGPIGPDPIREAALRIVAKAPALTDEQVNKIRDLLNPSWRPPEPIGVSTEKALCKAKPQRGRAYCPHYAITGLDYCRMHAGHGVAQ